MFSRMLSRLRTHKIKRVRARDLRDITDGEYERARACAAKVKGLVESRERVIQEKGVDPAFGMPDANWRREYHFFKVYELVSRCDYRVINRLRWYCQDFTAYQLPTFRPAAHTSVSGAFPDDSGDEVETFEDAPDPDARAWVEYWFSGMKRLLPRWAVARAPKVLGEVGWEAEGCLINHDVAAYQERLFLLHKAGLLSKLRLTAPTVVEIGGGYGALCYFLRRIFGGTYVIVDLPESLLFSSIYLSVTLPDVQQSFYDGSNPEALVRPGIVFCPNYLFNDLRELPCNLALNTLSFSEMSEAQIRTYAEELRAMLGPGGRLFEQNHPNQHIPGLVNAKEIFPDYFARRRAVDPSPFEPAHGRADVWSNG